MRLLNTEKKGPFTNLYYGLTWALGWEQILCMINAIVKNDFSKGAVQSLERGEIAGAKPVDITEEFRRAGCDVWKTKTALSEAGTLAIAGSSYIMEVPMRFTFYNQTDRLLVQIVGDTDGRVFDKYMDSIEITGHIEFALRHAKK